MRRIVISLSDTLYATLSEVSANAHEPMLTPEVWATECVESALASIRLPNVTPGRLGGRAFGSRMDADCEPEGYPVHLPEPSGEEMSTK